MRAAGLNAVITGGGSGLAAAAARLLAQEGAQVFVSDLDEGRALEVARSIDPSARRAQGMQCDIADPIACKRLVAEAELFFGRHIDIFLASAGRGFAGSLLDADPQEIKKTVDINVTGTIISCQEALKSMVKGQNGALIITGSLQGVTARSLRSVYTASKHALVGLVKALALEFGPQGVRINSIAPASTDTEFLRAQFHRLGANAEESLDRLAHSMPLGRLPTPDDFAQAVLFLGTSASRSVTGHTLLLDCGAAAGRQ